MYGVTGLRQTAVNPIRCYGVKSLIRVRVEVKLKPLHQTGSQFTAGIACIRINLVMRVRSEDLRLWVNGLKASEPHPSLNALAIDLETLPDQFLVH
jgi:hypothetical protein